MRARDHLDALRVEEGQSGLDERGHHLAGFGDYGLEQQGTVGQTAHRQVGVSSQRLKTAPYERRQSGVHAGQQLTELGDGRQGNCGRAEQRLRRQSVHPAQLVVADPRDIRGGLRGFRAPGLQDDLLRNLF